MSAHTQYESAAEGTGADVAQKDSMLLHMWFVPTPALMPSQISGMKTKFHGWVRNNGSIPAS